MQGSRSRALEGLAKELRSFRSCTTEYEGYVVPFERAIQVEEGFMIDRTNDVVSNRCWIL